MNEIADHLIEKIERGYAALGQDIARLRTLVGAPHPEPIRSIMNLPEDLIEVESAARIAGVRSDTVRSWCRENQMNNHPRGFALRISHRWWISAKPFRAFLLERK